MKLHEIPVAGFRIKRPNMVSVGDFIHLDRRLLVISDVANPFNSQGCTECPLRPEGKHFCAYRDVEANPPCLLKVDGWAELEFVILKEVDVEDI